MHTTTENPKMSRTNRNLTHSNSTGIRNVSFRNSLRANLSALDMLQDSDVTPSNRLVVQASNPIHPNDDLAIAALMEVDFSI